MINIQILNNASTLAVHRSRSLLVKSLSILPSLEFVIALVEIGAEMFFFLRGQGRANSAGAHFYLPRHELWAGNFVIRARKNGAAVAAHFPDVAAVAFVLVKQFFSGLRIAVWKGGSLYLGDTAQQYSENSLHVDAPYVNVCRRAMRTGAGGCES